MVQCFLEVLQVLTQQQKALCELLSVITQTTKEASESARGLGLCLQSNAIEELKQKEERSSTEQVSFRYVYPLL